MSSDTSVEVIVASFRTEAVAKYALEDIQIAEKQGYAQVSDVALLTRDENNGLHIDEEADKGFGHGAVIGGVAGAAIGLLAGPIGWAALGGAAIGGLASKLRDTGFPDDELRRIGQSIVPGSAAIVMVAEPVWSDNLQRLLEQHGAEVTKHEVPTGLAERLNLEAAQAQDAAPQPDRVKTEGNTTP
jgi:uncharacterized membrane protein